MSRRRDPRVREYFFPTSIISVGMLMNVIGMEGSAPLSTAPPARRGGNKEQRIVIVYIVQI